MASLGRFRLLVTALVVLAVCLGGLVAALLFRADSDLGAAKRSSLHPSVIVTEKTPAGSATATFAGGCFWCVEAAFQETPGVSNAIAGYAGGSEFRPSYQDVYLGLTGHREAIRVYFDPQQVSYKELLQIYWRSIDPTDPGGQFVDRGMAYTTAIFYENEKQHALAQGSLKQLEDSDRLDKPVATSILPFSTFYQAEDYHQDFYQHSSERYRQYTDASGRNEFKARVWEEINRG